MALLLETALGDIVIDLDYKGSPALTRNVLQLAKANAYKSNLIYKVLPQRFCMTGCPVGDGSGGTSIQGLLKGTKTAVSTDTSRLLSPLEMQEKGRVAVQGQSMGSQFLITIDQGKDHALDGIEGDFYSIGIVTEDDNHVLDKINAAYLDPNNRPFADIRILSALVVYDPFENEHSAELIEYIKKCPSASPERPPQETVEKRISVDEIDMEDNEDDNSSVDERKQRRLQEEEQQREAQSRAVVLEMLGDLPSADMKAPENVLFICKLNPVTTDEDLELIFSRFDQAVKVEIIRDHDTGDSLQYAFAEFTTPEQAQEAYFKMNHALVDDRRILIRINRTAGSRGDRTNGNNQAGIGEESIDTVKAEVFHKNTRRMHVIYNGEGMITTTRMISDMIVTSAKVQVKFATEIATTTMIASEEHDIFVKKIGYTRAETINMRTAKTLVTNDIEVMIQEDMTKSF
ncbi:peptidyl-prolyl cis-trans isomerase-like 4 [Fistulifera solaris]|uniref:Peptidyl-prolyl cis-trans isomerase n=1 Tax=Fistulifera solaris TaxID=1519565 RepID=A0A1Z5KMC3_FISSO|nr:peptidyl-prolyl cis-trans isomerase-like 4 [Fistulifera solaris]|eukprot:GAX27474.1 peptidyl-prolyl cis-trans isomerase-like 4 [Fistulifera solaris]